MDFWEILVFFSCAILGSTVNTCSASVLTFFYGEVDSDPEVFFLRSLSEWRSVLGEFIDRLTEASEPSRLHRCSSWTRLLTARYCASSGDGPDSADFVQFLDKVVDVLVVVNDRCVAEQGVHVFFAVVKGVCDVRAGRGAGWRCPVRHGLLTCPLLCVRDWSRCAEDRGSPAVADLGQGEHACRCATTGPCDHAALWRRFTAWWR